VIAMTLAEIAEALGGRLHAADPDALVTRPLEFDSRHCEPGGLFLALTGEHVDGHDFVDTAIANGAVAAITSAAAAAFRRVLDICFTPALIWLEGSVALSARSVGYCRRAVATSELRRVAPLVSVHT